MPLKTKLSLTLKMNLQLTQEVLIYRIFNGHDNQQCCPDGHLMLNGSFERRIRTSLGEFKMNFWRVHCSKGLSQLQFCLSDFNLKIIISLHVFCKKIHFSVVKSCTE